MLQTPAVFTCSFDDVGPFARALTQAEVSCFQTSTGPIQFDLAICKSPQMELHFTSMPLGGCIATGKTATTTQSFHIPLGTRPLIAMGGRQMEGDSFAAYAPGGEHVIRAHGGARLAYIVPSPELIEQTSFAHLLGKATIEEKANLEIISTGSDAMTRLQNFLQDLGSLATNTPQAMSNAQVFRHMEQVLMELLVAAYSSRGPEGGNTGRAPHSRRRVLHKIDELLRSKATEPVYVTDLCTVAGISQPTLYRVFYDTFEINPKRYLQLRRLHLARERLQDSSNPAQSVSTIAFDCGFWQLGRFGQAYRELFGETPSQTLRRSRNGAPKIS